jgi:hypothetical protein
MGSWRFFNRLVSGEGYVRSGWYWSVRRADASSMEAAAGFDTLRACEADALREGYMSGDEKLYQLSDIRWHG